MYLLRQGGFFRKNLQFFIDRVILPLNIDTKSVLLQTGNIC